MTVLSYTVWLGPFGGHEMGLTHYLGGARAAARYARKHGHPAKNNYGSSLFAVSAADGLAWAASTGALVAAFPATTRDGHGGRRPCRCYGSFW
ncbi:putative sAM-dependent methyltransferase [Mycobacterium xenopi 4042]|uniref:Putative sAM-dependent methyltransferase n=1 Tax=Mycobacterium xenopi 4042 TaxID=1299334 RepID=X7ZA46_MYCXE|nr:putative sAM-dependent methyltransferase [Mycobacterium xenopi 4042]